MKIADTDKLFLVLVLVLVLVLITRRPLGIRTRTVVLVDAVTKHSIARNAQIKPASMRRRSRDCWQIEMFLIRVDESD